MPLHEAAAGQRLCSYCGAVKPWCDSGKKLKDGSKIYLDGEGARWAGRRCPACERQRVKAAVRSDAFERQLVVDQIERSGFTIVASSLPLKVARDGNVYQVAIKRARTDGKQIVLDAPVAPEEEMIALVFASVRICSAAQLAALGSNLSSGGPAAPSTANHKPSAKLSGEPCRDVDRHLEVPGGPG